MSFVALGFVAELVRKSPEKQIKINTGKIAQQKYRWARHYFCCASFLPFFAEGVAGQR
jgi:hypothetical protein